MSKHTPGPWKVDERDGYCYGVTAEEGTLTVHNHGATSVSDYVAQPAHGHSHPADSQASANMRLIAAAPELLAALKRAHDDAIRFLNDGDFKRSVTWDAGYIVDAIAKAEGKAGA